MALVEGVVEFVSLDAQQQRGNEAEISTQELENENEQTLDHSTSPSIPRIRTSTRVIHPPVRMKDYVTSTSVRSAHPYSLANYMSYNHLSSSYQVYLSKISNDIEPRSYEEAIQDHRWVEAMK